MAPCSAYTVHRAGPGLPRFVVITTTPFAASVPYSAVADGPFTTSIDSISSELRSFTRLGGAHPTPQTLDERFALTMRTPSTTYTGSLLSDRLLVPRIRTRDGLPVWLPGSTWTPAPCALRRSVNAGLALRGQLGGGKPDERRNDERRATNDDAHRRSFGCDGAASNGGKDAAISLLSPASRDPARGPISRNRPWGPARRRGSGARSTPALPSR